MTKDTVKNEDHIKQLQMMRKEDMTLGQLYDFVRIWPEDLDGILFEQKINSTIADEFTRIQAKVDSTLDNVKDHNMKLLDFEKKVDICRA